MLGPADGIEREAIDSSNLVSIGYSADRQVCAVEFKSRLILHYSGVPLETAAEFYAAPSKGRFYSQRIRGKFTAQSMTGPCNVCQAIGIIGEPCLECGQGRHFPLERRAEPDRETIGPSDVDQVVR